MKVEERCGINWTWFKVQNGNLVAVFRLHHDSEQMKAFRKLQEKMTIVEHVDVPIATWREPCNLIADHVSKKEGYELPEVKDAFGWLNKMFRDVANDFEKECCPEGSMAHLEYHGVTIVRM